MPAVSLRFCLAAATLVALSGCASGEAEGDRRAEAQPAAAPAPATPAQPALATDSFSGLGIVGLLGPVPDEPTGKPNAAAVQGRMFNGAYAIELSNADRRRAGEAIHTALEWLPVGRMKIWRNPENGHWGTVTPTRTYQDANGAWCREFHQTVTIGGDENQDNGAACRRVDGVWLPMTS